MNENTTDGISYWSRETQLYIIAISYTEIEKFKIQQFYLKSVHI